MEGSRTQNRLVIVVGVIAIALALLAFVGPWWVVNTDIAFFGRSLTGTASYGPFGSRATSQDSFRNTTTTNSSDYRYLPATGGVFGVSAALAGLGILCGALVMASALMRQTLTRPKWSRLALGIMAFGFTLAAALYVMVFLPAAVTQDLHTTDYPFSGFWGSTVGPVYTAVGGIATYAAGWAWYIVLVAAGLFLTVTLLLLRTGSQPTDAAALPIGQQP